jgi:hypothetical protein
VRTSALLLSVSGALALSAAAGWWLSSAEVLRIRAIEDVPLFAPESLAGDIGEAPKQISQLKAGAELPVLACVDTKSNINLHAEYQGKVVAVGEWQAKIQLLRGHAYPWEPRATTSCQGFFESLSAHA